MAGGKRASSTRGTWPSAVRENFAVVPSDDPTESQLWAYSDRLSYAPGETLRLCVSTTLPRYDLRIYRDGANQRVVHDAIGLHGAHHRSPRDCSALGCGWPAGLSIEVGENWPSGGYVAAFTAATANGDPLVAHHVFVVRRGPSAPPAPILFIASTSTWIAYNDWGGSNHYEGLCGPGGNEASPVLSIERPWTRGFAWLPAGAPRIPLRNAPALGAALRYPHMEWAYANGYSKKYASAGWASYDRHFIRWADAAGFAVDAATQHDLHFDPALLDGYRAVVIVGHDEYWSWQMRDAVDRFVEGGGNVARFAGNFLWQARLEDGGRRQVCHKYRARDIDPIARDASRRHLLTTTWEAAEIGRPGVSTFGLNALKGLYAGWGGCSPRGAGGFTVYRPRHWAFAGADLYYGDILGAPSRLLGYEVDGLDYEMADGLPYPAATAGAPAGLEILAMGAATLTEEDHGHRGVDNFIGEEDVRFAAEILHGVATPETIEKAKRGVGMIVAFPKGRGQVLHAGTCEWVAGLIDADPFVDRITRTVLARFTGR